MNCRKCNRPTPTEEMPKRNGKVKEIICRRCQSERRNRWFEFQPEKHRQYLDYLKRWREQNRRTA